MQYKIINKSLMMTRNNDKCAWRIEPNIFEVIKSFLLWKYKEDNLPFFCPYIDAVSFPQLREWYDLLSKPNSPYKKVLKVTEEKYIDWVISLDFTKPANKEECNKMFEIISSATKREVDAIEIAENENIENQVIKH
jgi:hypothetical protein